MSRNRKPQRKTQRSTAQCGSWVWACSTCGAAQHATRSEVSRWLGAAARVKRTGQYPKSDFPVPCCVHCSTLAREPMPLSLKKWDRSAYELKRPMDLHRWEGHDVKAEFNDMLWLPSATSAVCTDPPKLTLVFQPNCPRRLMASWSPSRNIIRVVLYPGLTAPNLSATLLHEVAHAVAGAEAGHRKVFKATFCQLIEEHYGFRAVGFTTTHELDGLALRAATAHFQQRNQSQPETEETPQP
jgi:hypothetical protein